MTQAPTYLDIHVIQTVPPANLNRDDADSPKQAVYGDVLRARVSSQAWKRAARLDFVARAPMHADSGVRTLRVPKMLADALAEDGMPGEAAERIAVAAREAWGITPRGKNASPLGNDLETSYLLFLGREQVTRMAALLRQADLAGLDSAALKKAVGELDFGSVIGTGHPVDVALFGRMVADRAEWNVDASTQVAHALSTHGIDVEFDYFTAVDDENTEEETGAGMIGTIEFNSATLYRYANVGIHQLLENLEGDVDAAFSALRAFVPSFVLSMPSGHQNSFGHRTAPQAVALVVRQGQPVNLVTAFESPVRANSGRGIAPQSIERLGAELARATELWGLQPASVHATYAAAAPVTGLGPSVPFADALEGAVASVRTAALGSE